MEVRPSFPELSDRVGGKAGCEPRYVVFFRNAPDYALSLYHELRKHEFNRSFASFFLEICRTGSLSYRQWLFRFDRVTFYRDWCAATDPRSLSVFSYDRCAWQSGLVPSFLSVLSIHDPILLHAAQKAERLNVGEDPASLYLRSLASARSIHHQADRRRVAGLGCAESDLRILTQS